jgi:hypothetical protein
LASIFQQTVAFAISQAALRFALPRGVVVATAPNQFGALLEPNIYRDIGITDMYPVGYILDEMLVPALQVPAFKVTEERREAFYKAYQTGDSSLVSVFKKELKSDSASLDLVSMTKKVRKTVDYTIAKERFKAMMGEDGELDDFEYVETMYILRCLDTECSSSSLFAALNYYSAARINDILRESFGYKGFEVIKNKSNLFSVCEAVLEFYNVIEL